MATQAAKQLPPLMTVSEFLAWPGDGTGTRYELVEGVLRAMAPASDAHGTIHGNLAGIIRDHLLGNRPHCRLVVAPGIAPRLRSDWNHRIPELGVTCAANRADQHMTPEPMLLIEVLSPSNENDTWSNIPLYATVPSVAEILIVDSTKIEAQILRRGADGNWPQNPELIESGGTIRLQTIDLDIPLHEVYRGTHLAG